MNCWCNSCYLISIIWLYSATSPPFLMKNRKIEKERAKKEKRGLRHRGLQQFTPHYEQLPRTGAACVHSFHTLSSKKTPTNSNPKKPTRTDWLLVTLNPDTFCSMKRSIISSPSYDLTLSQFPITCEWCSSTDCDNTLKKRHLIIWMVTYAYLKSLNHYYDTFTLGCVFTIFPPQ